LGRKKSGWGAEGRGRGRNQKGSTQKGSGLAVLVGHGDGRDKDHREKKKTSRNVPLLNTYLEKGGRIGRRQKKTTSLWVKEKSSALAPKQKRLAHNR